MRTLGKRGIIRACVASLSLLALASLSLSIWFAGAQSGAAMTIELVGRQQTLTERMVKDVTLALFTGGREAYAEDVQNSVARFDDVLRTLLHEDQGPSGNRDVPLVPSTSAPAPLPLELQVAWGDMRAALEAALQSPPDSPARAQLLERVEETSREVRANLDAAHLAYETIASAQAARRSWSLAGLFGSCLLLLTLAYSWFRWRLLLPMSALDVAAGRIIAGNLTDAIAVNADSEIGRLGSALETMRRDLQARSQEKDAMTRLTALLVRVDESEQVVKITSQAIAKDLGASRVWVRMPDNQGRLTVSGLFDNVATESDGKAGSQPPCDEVVACPIGRCPAWRRGSSRGCAFLAQAGLGVASSLSVQLRAEDRPLGVVCVLSDERRSWSEGEARLLHQAAGETAAALVRIEAHQATLNKVKEEAATLRQAAKAKDDVLSITSHELRSPIHTILGHTELLLTRDFPESVRVECLNYIQQEGRRLARLVEDLLDFARIQSSDVQLRMTSVQLSNIVREAATAVQVTSSKHTIDVQMPRDLPLVRGDSDKLYQVLLNLLTNAIKYSPQGGLIVLGAQHEADHRHVMVWVQDQGIGLTPEEQQNLFSPFYRVKRSETRDIEGTGLGLYIVKRYVEGMQGDIWVESQVGEGSTFAFRVPMTGE